MSETRTINPTNERPYAGVNGVVALLAAPLLLGLGIWLLLQARDGGGAFFTLSGAGCVSLAILVSCGFYSLQPNEAYAITLFGAYVGTDRATGLREVASHYAYDHAEEGEPTLRADAEEVGDRLRKDLQQRTAVAGVAIDEAHLMHLAYAPEIAGSMLKRQQAEAVLAARRTIVAGAVDMVESALGQLSDRGVVALDDERRASMVSNLLVVLCADREAQPVVNTGTLYG